MKKIVFMGTPEFSVPILEALINAYDVVGVVTQPDRPAGRGGKICISPIKQVALDHNIPVFQPEVIRKPEAIETLRAWGADVYVVAAFGQILPQALLDIPQYGSINVHASILPRWRGASPIHASILAGDTETGVTIMKMDAGLDTGDMLSVAITPIAPDETAQTLHDKLSSLGAEILLDTLPLYFSGELQPQPQPEEGVTYAPQIEKEQGVIDWTQSAVYIDRLVRGFTPWPGTFTFWNGKQLKIHSGTVGTGSAEVGQVVELDGKLAIGTGEGLYYPSEVQLEGKKRVSVTDFLRGYPQIVGERLGE
jgi:methionyl-tRNA formyltransferase